MGSFLSCLLAKQTLNVAIGANQMVESRILCPRVVKFWIQPSDLSFQTSPRKIGQKVRGVSKHLDTAMLHTLLQCRIQLCMLYYAYRIYGISG